MKPATGSGGGGRFAEIELLAAGVAGLGCLGMMLIGGVDVVATKVFSMPVPGAYEITETMMVATVFLALALSQREGRQIRVELVTDHLPAGGKRALDVVADGCSFLVYALIAWYGIDAAWTSARIGEFTSGLINFPVWPAKIALALGATLMAARCAIDASRGLRATS